MTEQIDDGTWGRWMRFLASYHQWEVVGAENVPKTGGVVFAATHSLASYDIFIAAYSTSEFFGRKTLIVGDDLLFKIPGLGGFFRRSGFIAGTREQLIDRLKAGEVIGIAPGGMRESLRSRRHKHEFDWSKRKGFAAISLASGAPVVPAVCPAADDIYTVYDNPMTPWIYKRFKIPLPLFSGRGFTPLPRPVKLVHYVGKPIYPDVAPDKVTDADVERHHGRIVAAVQQLMREALHGGPRLAEEPRGFAAAAR